VYQVSQPLEVCSNRPSSVLSLNALLPTMRISLMRAGSPSTTLNGDVDAVALDRRDGGRHLGAIQAAWSGTGA
jgi:hypothetical protein